MVLDALFKKYFTLVVLGLLAVAAYFQASATTQLFGAALVREADAGAAGPAASSAANVKLLLHGQL